MAYNIHNPNYGIIPENTPRRKHFRHLYNTAHYIAINYDLGNPKKILRHYIREGKDTLIIETGMVRDVTVKIANYHNSFITRNLTTVFDAEEIDIGRLIVKTYCEGEGDTADQNWELHLNQLYTVAQLYDKLFSSINTTDQADFKNEIQDLERKLTQDAAFIINKNSITPEDNLPPEKSPIKYIGANLLRFVIGI